MADSYVVGIDLGTTNAVLAYAAVAKGKASQKPKILPIGQWVDQGVWQEKILFPTYRYHLLPHEQELLAPLPFNFRPLEKDFSVIFGDYAVKLGSLNRGQGVCSAKSWLSQAAKVHQEANDAFLPWGSNRQAAQSVQLVSPVVATASYLHYLHAWWNHVFPENPLSDQELVITLPASFDEYARDLTLIAAELAGLPHAQFLEEPTAAAYAWLSDQNADQSRLAKAGVMCVLDVGGGTTDLSLIDFRDPSSPKRLAVGDHLMLGGDNLDAAIAQMALTQMQEQAGQKIQVSSAQWSQLMLSARENKELIMSDQAPEFISLSLLGRGKSLIAQQKKAQLEVAALRDSLFEGFLPCLDFNSGHDIDTAAQGTKSGLVQVGLQFEQDTAMTRHLLTFLKQGQVELDSVLLNGGFFNAVGFQKRIADQLKLWSNAHWQGKVIAIEQSSNPQLAVALGAAIYGNIRYSQYQQSVTTQNSNTFENDVQETAPIIGGGSPRSLFLQLDTGVDQAAEPSVVCVAVKGMQECQPVELKHEFNLVLNQPVQFTLYSTTFSDVYVIGEILTLKPEWIKLPPMQVTIRTKSLASDEAIHLGEDEVCGIQTAPVLLVSEISMVGSLQLQFRSSVQHLPDTLLEFAGRSGVVGTRINKKNLPRQWQSVVELIETVYGPKNKHDKSTESDKEAMAALRKRIDQVLGPKGQWDVTLCRSLADVLLKWQKNRRRSARHEAFWLSTLGFAMRPGYGVVGDINRMEHVRKIIQVQPAHHEHSVWFAWWTLVRRIAPGLSVQSQRDVFESHELKVKSVMEALKLKSRMSGAEKKKSKDKKGVKKSQPALSNKEQDLKSRAPEAMLRAISSFDKIRGETWFETLLFELFSAEGVGVVTPLGVNRQIIAWCLGQVVARYSNTQGSQFEPIPVKVLELQLQRWLLEDWTTCPELGLAASIAAQRTRDQMQVSEALCNQVEAKLASAKLPDTWRHSIRALNQKDAFQEALAGESLPQGLGL